MIPLLLNSQTTSGFKLAVLSYLSPAKSARQKKCDADAVASTLTFIVLVE